MKAISPPTAPVLPPKGTIFPQCQTPSNNARMGNDNHSIQGFRYSDDDSNLTLEYHLHQEENKIGTPPCMWIVCQIKFLLIQWEQKKKSPYSAIHQHFLISKKCRFPNKQFH